MKMYTTAKELVKPTMRLIVRMTDSANGGMKLKELRQKVLEAYAPMMTVIDGHFSGYKQKMIYRTFNNMIYSKQLEKSGYGIYCKDIKEVQPTAKAMKEFATAIRITQEELILPAIKILREISAESENGRVSTSELFTKLSEFIKSTATEEDLKFNARNEPRYRQVIRNLVSHRALDKTGLVKYHSDTKEFEFIIKKMAA